MKDNPETNQSAIHKAIGLTLTERYLARRPERSFIGCPKCRGVHRRQGIRSFLHLLMRDRGKLSDIKFISFQPYPKSPPHREVRAGA